VAPEADNALGVAVGPIKLDLHGDRPGTGHDTA
jgi:hypothetical protein